MADAKGIRMGGGYVSLGVDRGPLDKGLEAAKSSFQTWGKGIAALGAAIATAGVAVASPFFAGLSDFMTWGSEMRTTMRMTNMGFAETQLAMNGMRLSAEELPAAIAKMDEFMVSAAAGGADANQALRDMGLTLGELQSMTRSDRLMAFADGLNRVGDEALRTTRIRDIFGRGGLAINIEGGAAGVRARADRAAGFAGDSRGEEAFRAATALGRAKSEMGAAVSAVGQSLAFAAAPIMMEFFQLITKIATAVRIWTDANRPLLATIFYIANKVILLGSAIGFLGTAIYATSYAFAFMRGAMQIVGGVFSLVAWIIVGVLSTAFWVLMTTITIVKGGLLFLSGLAIGVINVAFSVLAFLVGVVVSTAFLAMSITMTIVKSGFGLLTLASMTWGAVSLGWSLIVSAATFAYGLVLMALIPVFFALKTVSFLWGSGVAVVTAIATGAMMAYTFVMSAAAFVVAAYESAIFLAGVFLGAYAIITGIATVATAGQLAGLILASLGITGSAAATITLTAATAAHLTALLLDILGLKAHTVMTVISTIASFAYGVALVGVTIAMGIYKVVTFAAAIAMGALSFMMGVAKAATWLFTGSLIAAWFWENLVSLGINLIISALIVLVMGMIAFVAIMAFATITAITWAAAWIASFFTIQTASRVATAAGEGVRSMVRSLASSISEFASNIGTAFSSAITSVLAYIGQFFTTFMEVAEAAFGHVADVAIQAFGIMQAAFSLNEWTMIWETFLVAAQLIWIRLYPAIISFKDGLIDAFVGIWDTVKSTFIIMWGEIKATALTGISQIIRASAALTPAGPLRNLVIARAESLLIDARIARQFAARDAANVGNTIEELAARLDEQARRIDRDMAAEAGDAAEVVRLNRRLIDIQWELAEGGGIAGQNDIAAQIRRQMQLLGGQGQDAARTALSSSSTFNRFAAMGWMGANVTTESEEARNARLARENLDEIRRLLARQRGVVMA